MLTDGEREGEMVPDTEPVADVDTVDDGEWLLDTVTESVCEPVVLKDADTQKEADTENVAVTVLDADMVKLLDAVPQDEDVGVDETDAVWHTVLDADRVALTDDEKDTDDVCE